ncbi:Target of rapamycin complex 2 subunit avo2 [Sorochytrium milnesiophthora]
MLRSVLQRDSSQNFTKLVLAISEDNHGTLSEHLTARPQDAKLQDPYTGAPLLFHAIQAHKNKAVALLLEYYDKPPQPSPAAATTAPHDSAQPTLVPNSRSASLDSLTAATMAMKIEPTPSSTLAAIKEKERSLSYQRINSFPRDFAQNSPLHAAAQHNNDEVADLLLAHFPHCVNAQNNLGRTPLFEACIVGSESLVQFLLRNGASIHECDRDGNTALHHAAAYNHFGIVALLIHQGANFLVRNKKRWTPLDYAYSETLQSFFQELVREAVTGKETGKDPMVSYNAFLY